MPVHNEEVKERPILFSGSMVRAILEGRKTQTRRIIKFNESHRVELRHKQWHIDDPNSILACPFGVKGDRLWVRESCWIDGATNHVHYCATDTQNAPKKTPSIFMPRWASRITLEVVGVMVERLQDITNEDAKAEGLKSITKDNITIKWGIPDADGYPGTDDIGWPWSDWNVNPIAAYKRLWESINGPGSWEASPRIWVIDFKKINKE